MTAATAHRSYLKQDVAFLRYQNDLKPVSQPAKLISKWINGRRIMPPSSPFPGIYSINKTPYIIELCDNMSPYSRVTGQAVKKGVQIAITTAVENCIAYYWKERARDQMLLTGTEDLFKKFNTKRLQPLIQSCNLEVAPQEYNKRSRKSGDTVEIKEYRGGSLILGSIQSSAHMRSDSIQIMYVDEIDLIDAQMSSGEGNPLKVLDGRMIAFGDRAKSFSLSTPREYDNSLIDIQYARGDKRKFFVRCPLCNKEQWLCMGKDDTNYGLKADTKAGKFVQGYYLCFHCHDALFEGQKIQMLNTGIWMPTVEPAIKNYRSYHIPSFYSPFMSWSRMRQEYDEAVEQGDDGMRSYTNLYLGKSFKPSGQRPKFQSVIEIRSKYKSGTVPRGVMYLTAATDVQQGIKKYWDMETADILKEVERIKKEDPVDPRLRRIPRLELEVIGHGRDFRTASIIYKHFYGRIDDENAGAWQQMTEWIEETGLKFKRADGFEFGVHMFFIDSGHQTDLVYSYCDPRSMTYAIKGDRIRKQDKLKMNDIDEPHAPGNVTRFRLSKSGSYSIVLINIVYYKTQIYRQLGQGVAHDEAEQPRNSHRTPVDYPDQYFKGLTAEEHKLDGSFHNRAGRSNEPLVLLGYNKSAADFFIENEVLRDRHTIKTQYEKKGRRLSVERLRELVNRKTVTDRWEKQLRARGW